MFVTIEESDRIEMSRTERDRLKVLYGVIQGERSQKEAARLLRLTERQVRRLLRRIGRRLGHAVKSHFNVLAFGFRSRDWQTVFTQSLQMQRDCLGDQLLDLCGRFPHGDAAGQIRDIRTVTCRTFFDDNGVTHQSTSGNCACFQMLFSVLIGTSTLA